MGHITGTATGDTTNEIQLLESEFGQIEAIGLALTDQNFIDNLDVLEGEPAGSSAGDNVMTGQDLEQVLQDVSPTALLSPAGGDSLAGNQGSDIIFGDSVFTDTLATAQGLSTEPGSGWAVFDELEASPGWTRAQTELYILGNHAQLSAESTLNGSGRTGGNDTIDGGAGADIIYGQEGNDTLIYDTADTIVDGGSGTDTLLLQVAQTIDASSASGPLNSIEVIDLGATGANTVSSLDPAAAQGILGASTGTLYILGTGDDIVTGSGWGTGTSGVTDSQFAGHTFTQYSNSGVTLRIETAINETV